MWTDKELKDRALEHKNAESKDNATLRAENERLDKMVRAIQDAVCESLRDAMTKIGRDPDDIDGSGSDGDEVYFTQTEVRQFVECAIEDHDKLVALRAAIVEYIKADDASYDCEDEKAGVARWAKARMDVDRLIGGE